MSSISKFMPNDTQIKEAKKSISMGNYLKLKKAAISKAGINLFPKVEKAIYFLIAALNSKFELEKDDVDRICNRALEEIKSRGKIANDENINDIVTTLFRNIVEEAVSDEDKSGLIVDKLGGFENLPKVLKRSSVMGKAKNVTEAVKDVVSRKVGDKRRELEECIKNNASDIEKYYNNDYVMLNSEMEENKQKIDALRSEKSRKNKKFNLVKDINVKSFYRVKSIDDAIGTINEVKEAIDKINNESLEKIENIVKNQGDMLEDYFNSFRKSGAKMGKFALGHLERIRLLMGNKSTNSPIKLDAEKIINNDKFRPGFKLEILKNAIAYVSRVLAGQKNKK